MFGSGQACLYFISYAEQTFLQLPDIHFLSVRIPRLKSLHLILMHVNSGFVLLS